jgi:hypothetical protein
VSQTSEDARLEPIADVEETASSEQETLPLWFQRGLVVVSAAVVSFGAIGLFLADLGAYSFAVVLPVGLAATVGLSVLAWLRKPTGTFRGAGALPATGMCLVALVFFGWNSYYASQHVAIGRDPGVYTVTGKWIAKHGNLEVKTGTDWSSKTPDAVVQSPGTYVVGSDELQFQFAHLAPVLFAEADNLGGDRLLFRVPALLSALALCAIYAVGCRLVKRPWLVLGGVIALGLSLPQVNVARDTLSESATEFLVWAGIFLLVLAFERRRLGLGLLAGATLGSTMMAHIDAPVYLIPLPVLGAIALLASAPGRERRSLAALEGSFVVGVVPVVAIGSFDLMRRAGHYYDDLHSDVHRLQLGVGAAFVIAVALLVIWPRLASRSRAMGARLSSSRATIATAVGLASAALLTAAWALRPDLKVRTPNTPAVEQFVAGLQRVAGLPIDPTRTYAEQTISWFSWYLGPVCVAIGIIGFGVLIARVIRTSAPVAAVVLTIAGIGTAVYLWKPNISPDQVWAMRRFVPVGMPLLVLLAVVGLAAVANVLRSVRMTGLEDRLVPAVGVLGLVAFPLATTAPVRGLQPQHGYATAVQHTCGAIGARAAVLTATADTAMQELLPAIRSWCDVPAATLSKPMSADQIQSAANLWRAEGRTLWVLGSNPVSVTASAPGLSPSIVASAQDPRELTLVVNGPPQAYIPGSLAIYASQAP